MERQIPMNATPTTMGAEVHTETAVPSGSATHMDSATHIAYLLRLADNALVLSHRLAEWTGHGPVLEEDIAMTNIALDLLGQARLLYQHAGSLSAPTRTEDELAYFRDTAQFRNFTMLELPNSGVASAGAADGDYAFTIVRNFLYSAWALPLWQALAGSADAQLAAIAGKAVKGTRHHLRHAGDWLGRLGDGTEESHRRMETALDMLLPYTNEWFAADELDRAALAAGIGADLAGLREQWLAIARPAAEAATLRWPADSGFRSTGKQGLHSEHLDYLLNEMQSLARAHPGAVW